MSKCEEIFGKIMATLLILLFVWALFSTVFNVVIKSDVSYYGYGARGEMYRSSGY